MAAIGGRVVGKGLAGDRLTERKYLVIDDGQPRPLCRDLFGVKLAAATILQRE